MSSIAQQLNIGSIYNFETYASDVLGSFRNVRLRGIIDFRSTAMYGLDAKSVHANIRSRIPGLPLDPADYSYAVFVDQNNQDKIIGLPWINPESLELRTVQQAIVYVDNISPDNYNALRRAIVSNGYSVSKIVPSES